MPIDPILQKPSPTAVGVTPPLSPQKKEPEIVTIPEKFYGMALKMQTPNPSEERLAPSSPPPKSAPKVVAQTLPKHPLLPVVMAVIVLLAVIGGLFVYFNRHLIFRPKEPVAPVPVIVSPPSSPASLTASTTGATSIALVWVDTSVAETGFRLERKEGESGTFLALTNLPANSAAFLDVSVQSARTYTYRVIAMNDGGDSGPSNEATAVTPQAVSVPTKLDLPPGGLDSDSDGVSDVEEPLYGTDGRHPDADQDGFLDGNEVFHLYNPAAQAPIRLLDSGLVTVLSGPIGWQIYVPKKWTAVLGSPDGRRATISSGTGETFEIFVEENPAKLSLMEWYLQMNIGTLSSEMRTISTKGKLEGLLGKDRMEAVFIWDGRIFRIQYALHNQPFVNYRTTFEMMLNSLHLGNTPAEFFTEVSGGPGALLGIPPVASTSSEPNSASSTIQAVTTSSTP